MKRLPVLPSLLVVAVLGVVIYAIVMTSQPAGEMKPRLAKKDVEAPALFESLPLPATAKPYAPRTQQRVEGRRHWTIVVEQEFEAPGPFGNTIAMYERELPAAGWKLYDTTSVDRKFCKAPYTLTVEKHTWTEENHRFRLRLIYDDSRGGGWKCA